MKNRNKLYVGITFGSMALLSLIVSIIMSKNFQKDTSKLRHNLTVAYKKHKDIEYVYSEKKALRIFNSTCVKCHGGEGVGTRIAPALKENSSITDNPEQTLSILINGLEGKLIRHDKTYNSSMPAYSILAHEDMAHVINYLRTKLNHAQDLITTVDVITAKVNSVEQVGPLNTSELKDTSK